ncbi:unnamed protein product [Xylocopa violacea]|uniref:Uncharacterized protein n=1 Tax=Xylocopa violacea TaxID=135666 RepID=A0ABP1NJ55_XYLVO
MAEEILVTASTVCTTIVNVIVNVRDHHSDVTRDNESRLGNFNNRLVAVVSQLKFKDKHLDKHPAVICEDLVKSQTYIYVHAITCNRKVVYLGSRNSGHLAICRTDGVVSEAAAMEELGSERKTRVDEQRSAETFCVSLKHNEFDVHRRTPLGTIDR